MPGCTKGGNDKKMMPPKGCHVKPNNCTTGCTGTGMALFAYLHDTYEKAKSACA
jgi:hypothetical protein